MDYYTKHIMSNDNWEFAGIYADEGITGTQVKKRAQFLKMIKDCEKGKIDMILTKSVSRFARNIVDSISYVRRLKAMGISIYFEEQHIVELANLAIKSPHNRDKYESAISDCTDRIKVLRERREEILRQLNFNQASKAEIERIEHYLTEDRAVVTEFDDCTVRRLVNSISISKDMELTIYLKGGYEVKEKYLPLKNTA